MHASLRRWFNPLGLTVLGAGVATAAATSEFWLVPMAVVGWGLLALGYDRGAAAEPGDAGAEARAALTGPRAQTEQRLRKLAAKIGQAVAESTPAVRVCVEELPGLAQALVEECRELLAKLSALDLFLAEAEGDQPRLELERVRANERAARDESVRQRWAQARVAAEARLAEFAQIETNRARMEAELAEAETRLKHVHSRIVSLDSRDEESLTGLAGELRGALGELTQQIAVSDRVLSDAPRPVADGSGPRTPLAQ
ncbi:MAG: hypothetical protein JSR82_03780 [Verrucomicrobia bacterium]|nr:hypothetical protein [Verrucomicrobiota bacterium]